MTTKRQLDNRVSHARRKEREASAALPTIPAELAKVIGDNALTSEQERIADAAIAKARLAIHDRRAFREDVKKPYELPNYSTTKQGIVRCA